MSALAWVAWGEDGEYSDRRVWVVRAFTDEGEARAFVEAVSAQAREVWTAWMVRRRRGEVGALQDRVLFPIPLDPVGNRPDEDGFHSSYDYAKPVQYHLDEVPLGPVAA